jgi:hypothetical protein
VITPEQVAQLEKLLAEYHNTLVISCLELNQGEPDCHEKFEAASDKLHAYIKSLQQS